MDYNSSMLSTWMKNFLNGLSKCPVWGQSNRRWEINLPPGFMRSITSKKKKKRVCRSIIISVLLSCRHIHALHEMYFEIMPHGLWDIYKEGSIKSRCSSVRSSLDRIVVIASKSLSEFSEISLTSSSGLQTRHWTSGFPIIFDKYTEKLTVDKDSVGTMVIWHWITQSSRVPSLTEF